MELYNSNWYNMTNDEIKEFLIILKMSQIEVGLKKGYFGILSLNSFSEIMQSIYSIFTLVIKFIKN